MDTQRLILFVIFSMSALFLWEAWQKEQRPPVPPTVAAKAQPGTAPRAPSDIPRRAVGHAPRRPAARFRGAARRRDGAGGADRHVTTDLYRAEIDTVGGVITQVALLAHRDPTDETKPYLGSSARRSARCVAQSGLLGEGMPNHRPCTKLLPGPRELAPGADTLDLTLAATAANGDKVVQVLTFHRGSYVIDVAYEVTNAGAAPISPYAYFQLDARHQDPGHAQLDGAGGLRRPGDLQRGRQVQEGRVRRARQARGRSDAQAAVHARAPTTAGSAWSSTISSPRGCPPTKRRRRASSTRRSSTTVSMRPASSCRSATIAPGATGAGRRAALRRAAGPGRAREAREGLDLVVDYGIFTVIAAPLFWLLKWLYGIIGNWGWAIIAMTIIIKSAFYPLNHASARSMAKMKVIAPKLKALQEQYANDKQQLQVKMMEMYKQEKINPLGGCLPILVQIPVFIALYWVLLSAVELRHAPWICWIHDLSAPDPYFVLPVVYAITAYLQVKLSPTPISDPVQAKVMQIMPIAFSVMFVFFPSGLVLYWLVNNCIQIFQQWHMNRLLEKEAAAAAAKRR